MKTKYDMVSIGDCTIDAFVEVEEATTECDINNESCHICFSFADKIPYKSLTALPAGNANNFAIGVSRLGLRSALYSSVGADLNGKIILENLKKDKVDRKLMSVQKNAPTNFHVVLSFKGERTILIKHQDYKYALPKGIDQTAWLYLTSVGKKGLSLHSHIVKLLRSNKGIKMAFNPGTFQLRLGLNKIRPLIGLSEILFLNKEEARFLLAMPHGEIREMSEELRKIGAKIVVITDGLKGAYALDDKGFYYIGIYPHEVIEATGCGDAFATGFTAARIHNLPVSEALRWGGRNGASVATKIGPQPGLMAKEKMESDLKKAGNFRTKQIKDS